jgi:hypothetical protein
LKEIRRSAEVQRNIHDVIKVKTNWCCSDQLCKIKKESFLQITHRKFKSLHSVEHVNYSRSTVVNELKAEYAKKEKRVLDGVNWKVIYKDWHSSP